jgi:Ca-activated chloride channel family protein
MGHKLSLLTTFLVSVAIVAVLAAISIPSLLRARVSVGPSQHPHLQYQQPVHAALPQGERLISPDGGWAPPHDTESYDRIYENPFLSVAQEPLSTFAVDVDTAAYANTRRFITQGTLPPPGAVRIEELINYFRYDYAEPTGPRPFSVATEVSRCPWARDHRLVSVALQGRRVPREQAPPLNLVFLLDVSGSMDSPLKLPLLKSAMRLLVERLGERDRVAIVVYAGETRATATIPTSTRSTRPARCWWRRRAGRW